MTTDTAPGDLMDAPRPARQTARQPRRARASHDQALSILRVPVSDVTMDQALDWFEQVLTRQPRAPSHAVFFVNAHTLNVASDDPSYLEVLRSADRVYGDGTGVRWAARLLHGRRLRDNVNGTDVVPQLFSRLAGRGLSYYLLGNTPERIGRASAYAQSAFPGWRQAGCHHGFLWDLGPEASVEVVRQINASGADVLLVGMGNPKQEQWIARHLHLLEVPLCMGTGGLFDYWVGDLVRAPAWVRRIGYEWLHLLIRQPHKARRYLLGNPLFLLRVLRNRLHGTDRAGREVPR